MEYIENNPFQQLNAKAGTMIYELVKSKDQDVEEFAFLIKEETKFINRHKYRPQIELRTGLIKIDNVWVVPVMLIFDNDFDMLYEMFFNYHQTSGGKIYLNALQNQDFIPILFFDENNKNIRQVQIKNQIKEDFEEINMRLDSSIKWSMSDFDKVKLKMYEMYKTPLDLWDILRNK